MILFIIFYHYPIKLEINKMSNIQKVVDEFKNLYVENEEEVSLSEMKKKLTEIYKKHNDTKKAKKTTKKGEEEDEEKKKRKPSVYNLYMRQKMLELKEDKSMNGKEKMAKIAEMWKEEKEK